MLPSYGGQSMFGKPRRRPFGTAAAVGAGSLLLLVAWACLSFRRVMMASKNRELELQESLSGIQRDLQHQRTMYNQLDSTFHITKRALVETQHALTVARGEVSSSTDLENSVTELVDKLDFERRLSQVLQQKIAELEQHYKAREVDWHELAESWANYEKETTTENSRLLGSLSECQKRPLPESPQHAPMPAEEPTIRTETEMVFDVNMPEFQERLRRAQELRKQQVLKEQQQLQQQQQQQQEAVQRGQRQEWQQKAQAITPQEQQGSRDHPAPRQWVDPNTKRPRAQAPKEVWGEDYNAKWDGTSGQQQQALRAQMQGAQRQQQYQQATQN